MSRVIYNSQRLIPAPFVNIDKEYQKAGNGDIVGKLYRITVTGTLVAFKGSPNSDGEFHTAGGYPTDETVTPDSRLSSIQRKQEALRKLFSTEGYSFEIQADDASTPVKCNPRVVSISFPEGTWYDRCEYTIVLEADELYPDNDETTSTFSYYISSAEESWSLETNESLSIGLDKPYSFVLTHSIAAVGKKFYNESGDLEKEAWEQAKTFVQAKLGIDTDRVESDGVLNLTSYEGYNHVRNENTDKYGGRYSVVETWMLADDNALEDFSVSTETSIDKQETTVAIQGNITGLEVRDSDLGLTTSKYTNASDKYATVSSLAFSRAETYSGIDLNSAPISQTVGKNPIAGTINYTYQYDNRPTNMIANANYEVINISDNLQGDKHAAIFVLGRSAGPVLQNLGTTSALHRTLSIEIVVDAPGAGGDDVWSEAEVRNAFFNKNPRFDSDYASDISKVIAAANPSNQTEVYGDGDPGGFGQVYEDTPQESWEPKTGRYTYTTGWTFEA
jgi:hypothetical protein